MAKSTFLELQNRVSGLVANGVTLSANTTPTLDNVNQWINDAQRDIATQVPGDYLDTLLKVENPSIGAVDNYDLSSITDYLKPYTATLNIDGQTKDVPITIVSKAKALSLMRNTLVGLSDSPIGWFEGNKFYWKPATTGAAATGKLKLSYIVAPTKLTADADVSDLREVYEDAIVYRACAKHYLAEEEIQVYLRFQEAYVFHLQKAIDNI